MQKKEILLYFSGEGRLQESEPSVFSAGIRTVFQGSLARFTLKEPAKIIFVAEPQ